MLQIKQIDNDKKNIIVNDTVMPAIFTATAKGDLVKIISTIRLIESINSQGLHYSQIEINGEVAESANDAVLALNAFTGSFKSDGENGSVSPDDAGDTIIEGTADIATRILNKRCYKTSSYLTVKIDEDVKIQIDNSGGFSIIATSGKFNVRGRQFTRMNMYIGADPEGNPVEQVIPIFERIDAVNNTAWSPWSYMSEDFYVVYLETEAGNRYKITAMDGYIEIEKISL